MSSARLPNPGTAASGRSSSPPASLHQTIAFLLLYPRLLYLVALPPLAILSVPLLFYAFNALTAGYALAALLFAAGLYGAGRLLLASVAETPEAIAKGVARNQVRLPLFCFVTSVGLVHFLVHFVVGDRFAFYPSASVLANTFGRVAVCVLLWEGATLVRYVGPPSLVRCSSVPLVSNPFGSAAHYWWQYPLSFLVPRTEPTTTTPPLVPMGRRYQYPSFVATLAQVLALVVLGAALFVTSFPLLESMECSTALLVISLGSVLVPIVPYVHGQAHELDPRAYLTFSDAWWKTTAGHAVSRALLQGSGLATLAYIVQVASSEGTPWSWKTAVALLLWAALGVWMPFVWEQSLRLLLFCPRPDVTRDVLDMADNSLPVFMRVVLRSLLLDSSLVEEVCTLPMSASEGLMVWQMDETELRRVRALVQRFGQQLLQKTTQIEAPLEEDVLRWNLLQALGGGNARKAAWLLESSPPSLLGTRAPEPPVATLVRGLIVAVGGMGEALQRITALGATHARGKLDTWTLSTGALLSLEYTLTALGRLLAPTEGSPRTATHLTALVPAALTSLHSLYMSLVWYSKSSPPHPELLQTVMRSCAQTAVTVLTRVAPKGPLGSTGEHLDKEVVAWLQGEACQDLYASRM